MQVSSTRRCLAGFGLAGTLALCNPEGALAGGQTIRLADDSNSRLEIKDAIAAGDRTTVLFWTWPDRGDPNFRNDCGKNYYTVTLRPGLADARPRLLAGGACAGTGLLQGGLLADGSGKFIVQDRLEHWRDGKRISSKSLAGLEQVGTLGLKSSEMGSQLVDFSPAGHLAMAVSVTGQAVQEWPGLAVVIAALDPDDDPRWLVRIEQGDDLFSPEQLWAGEDGSALLRYFTVDTQSIAADQETRLLHISADGQRVDLPLVKVAQPYDVLSMKPGSEEDLQKAFAYMDENRSERIDSLAARPRTGGGFEILYRRKSDSPERDGYFLLRLDPTGAVASENPLGSIIEDHGLDRWFDFYVDGRELVLLSSVPVTQQGVNSRRKKWAQTAVSQIGIESGSVDARLVPLERKYLEAAMNAGDADQQYLAGQPGGTPVLLTTLGGVPLSLSKGWVEKRGTLRMFEATDDLVAFTEHFDERQAELAKQAERESKKTRRDASQRQFREDVAAAAGMTAEEFDRLSKEEQAARMMQGGNLQAIMESAMKQAEAAQAGLTPEQATQLQAQMAQVQRMMQGGAGTAGPAVAPDPAPENAANSFTVDALNRGRIRFSGDGATTVTLSLVDRSSGVELMAKKFPGGEIDEYVSLGSYQLPAKQIGAIVRGPSGEVLADLYPEENVSR